MSYTIYGAPALCNDGTGYDTTDEAEKSLKRLLNLIVPVYDTKEELFSEMMPGVDPKEVGIAEITITVRRLSDIQQH